MKTAQFPCYPASTMSIAKRKPVYGIGINNADYLTNTVIGGKQVMCPFYQKWKAMLKRSYSPAYHLKRPTYIGCTVTGDWLTFSNFRSWMVEQDWEGKELDKDLLVHGNKLYSPDTCIFVSNAINLLLTDHAAARGNYPQGVSWHKRVGKFNAQISLHSKLKHLGYFDTPEEASAAYNEAKSAHIIELAQSQPQRVKAALIAIAERMIAQQEAAA